MVCNQVVYIVTTLPPSDRQATAKVRDEDTYYCVIDEVRCHTSMTSVMSSEHDLVLVSH